MNAALTSAPQGAASSPNPDSPYIGLRYFEESDAGLFYGRDEHTAEILGKLSRDRFVAVLGSSGSGKSSLVRAGLLPELRSGMIPQAGPRWRIVEFKPGNAPLEELSNALRTSLGVTDANELIEEGPLGIVNAVAAARLPERTNVLLIADQFEEVFRFQREERDQGRENQAVEQCQALVRRLLDASDQMLIPLYVLLVMRSDYLGECAQFLDLPERISSSMYLIPRLRRDQVQEVITAPVSNNIEPELVQELLGKAGGDPDQLPRLQHLLNRIWKNAGGARLGLAEYREAGEWDGALAKHLDEALAGLGAGEVVCARMFQQLSDVDDGNRVVRRRAPMDELAGVCGPSVSGVVSAFRSEGFIRPGTPVDITHECILRNWDRVKGWLQYEAGARDFYREIRARQKRRAMLSGLDLITAKVYLGWRQSLTSDVVLESAHYTEPWAKRYGTAADFESVREFVRASVRTEHNARLLQRFLIAGVLTLLGVVFAGLVSFVWQLREEKHAAVASGELEKRRAAHEKELADAARGSAITAQESTTKANAALILARREQDLAEEEKKEADLQRNRADAEAARAAGALASLQEYVGSHEAAHSGTPSATPVPEAPEHVSAARGPGLSARDLAKAYNFPSELNGKGQTIAFIELGGGYRASDLTAFFGKLRLPVPHMTSVPVDGGKNEPDGTDGAQSQVTADIELSGAVASGAGIMLYFAPNTSEGFLHAIAAASHGTASIISMGWGAPEASWTPAAIKAMNAAFQDASTRGKTLVAASGDYGASDGLSGMRAVDFPASSPWVLACGGTKTEMVNGRIVSERVWNDGTGGGATGGGFSSVFPVPSWQSGLSYKGVEQAPETAKFAGRGIPDVAANASPLSGFLTIVNGRSATMGGTAMTAPFWAGLVALINEALGRNVGFLNPVLYKSLGASGAFRAITEGNNSVGNVKGFTAGPGWNPVSGWGSPDGLKLINALKTLKP